MNKSSGSSFELKKNSILANQYIFNVVDFATEPMIVLDHNKRFIYGNTSFFTTFSLNEKELSENVIYDLPTAPWDVAVLKALLEEVLPKSGELTGMEIPVHGINEELHLFSLKARVMPEVSGQDLFLLSFHPKNSLIHREKEGFLVKSFENIFANAPAMICILRGPDHVYEQANEPYYQLIGNRNVLGKPVREAVPEAEGQGFFELLDEVRATGKPHQGFEAPFEMKLVTGETKKLYIDFVFQPTWDSQGQVDGIFVYVVDVTEKVIARKKIEESESELRRLIDTVPAMIWITNKDGESLYLNDNWYRYTGQAPREAEGFGWLKATHPEDMQLAEDAFRKALENQREYNVSFRLRNKNGNYRWVIDQGSPKFNDRGEFEGMVGTVIDVHEEKLKEQLVRESEHRIRNIVKEATVATGIYIGKEMKIELANEAMIKLWGKKPDVIGKTLGEALPELEGQPFHKLLEQVFTTGKTYWGKEDKVDLVINGRMQTGYFNFTYKPLRNQNGEIYGILNMAVDVTELVRSKMLVKESEVHFRQMADLMPTKVTNTDAAGNFIYFNQDWLEYTGLTFKDLNERGWIDFIHPDERTNYRKRWQSSLDSGVAFEMELRCLNRNGKYKWHISRAEAVKNDDGSIKMWIATTTEIQKLKEEEKRKGDFLKMVSHELKTPVTSIKGYVQLLLKIIQSGEEAKLPSLPIKPSLERIDHQIKRLTRLISEMLDLSKIEENKLELKKEVFSINELVTQTVQDIIYTNTQHNIQVIHETNCKVFADKDRIGQVLINLVVNAIKYSPDNKDITVSIKKNKKNQVAISVKDKGIGIEKKNHKNIFKRFYRIGGKSEETYSGFGIGLYLANEIIERHKGSITVKSKKGKGSEFCFILSVAQEK